MTLQSYSIGIKFVRVLLLSAVFAFGLLGGARVAVAATVISPAELAGTWHFHGYSDDPLSHNPDWTYGTIIVDAFGDISGGTVTKGDGTSATVLAAGSSLRIDASGVMAGEVVADFGTFRRTLRIFLGRLDAGQTLGTVAGIDTYEAEITGPPFLGTIIKGGGTFAPSDLAGTWYFNSLSDNPTSNNPDWTSGTIVVGPTGNVTGGAIEEGDGLTAAVIGGSFNVSPDGLLSGSVTTDFGGGLITTTTITFGKLDISQTMGAVVGSDNHGHRFMGTMVKAGGIFTPSPVAGTWFFQSFSDDPAGNDPGWTSGTLIVDAGGNITAGHTRQSSPWLTAPVLVGPGSRLAVDAAGGITGSVVTDFGTFTTTTTITRGKLDVSRSKGTVVGSDNHGHRLMGTLVKISAAPGIPMAWGENAGYQIGDGTSIDRHSPVPVSALAEVADIAGGGQHSLAAKSDGSAWAWGSNSSGQLGDGTFTDRVAATRVTGLSDVIDVAAGGLHSLAVKSDGTAWAWGDNSRGQLGDGTTSSSQTPVQVSGLTGVVAIEAGEYHSLALKVDGTVWAWGENSQGQLGDGSTTPRATPVQVTGLSDVRIIAAGGHHNLANTFDGRAWAWGDNSQGQLGNGTLASSLTPVHVLSDVGIIAAGGSHSLAVTSDGTIWVWGRNAEGQLGDGTLTNQVSPVPLASLMYAVAMVAGESHSIAVIADGNAWAWGDNSQGQLGDGTTTNHPTPVRSRGLAGAVAIAAGAFHSQAIIGDRDRDGIVDPVDGQVVAGVFVDHRKVYSANFTDQNLGGVSFGFIADRSDLTVNVLEAVNPAGVWLGASSGAGTATVNACGFDVFLTAGDSTVVTCSSLAAQVFAGPIEIQLAPDILVVAPAGVTLTVTQLSPEQFRVENAAVSLVSLTILSQGQEFDVPPGNTFVTGDTTPPVVTAAFVPLGEVEEDEGRFRIEYACRDSVDPSPAITAAAVNGIPVHHGQVVKLELDDETEVKIKDGVLKKLEAPFFTLVVSCSDASGNAATATASPQFSSDDDDDDDEDEDEDEDDKKKRKTKKERSNKYRD